jgi:non-specific serine/threonine protein kinase
MSAPPEGSILGDRYELQARLGDGPGRVEYRARDRELDVEVALWWIAPELFADPARRDAVLGAGVELRGLRDLALRQCHGVGRGDGALWAVWQPSTGTAPMPKEGAAVPIEQLRRWFAAVTRGLAALHRQGLVHGRLAPSDIVSVGGNLKLGGGGLWRDVDPVAALRAWTDARCDAHLAPEVRRYQAPTEASDVWSIASIALEMIAGVSAATPDCARAAARRHPSLAAVLVGAMTPDPGRRPELAALAEAVATAAEAPYLEPAAAGKGKAAAAAGEKSTLIGHASGAQPAAPPRRTATVKTEPPPPSGPPKPGAFKPQPASFALPTPSGAPRAPRPTPPAVEIAPKPTAPPAAPAPTIPTPANTWSPRSRSRRPSRCPTRRPARRRTSPRPSSARSPTSRAAAPTRWRPDSSATWPRPRR